MHLDFSGSWVLTFVIKTIYSWLLCPLPLGKGPSVFSGDVSFSHPQSHRLLRQTHTQASPLLPNTQRDCCPTLSERWGQRSLSFGSYTHFQSNHSTRGFKHQVLRSWQLLMLIFITSWTRLTQGAQLTTQNWSTCPLWSLSLPHFCLPSSSFSLNFFLLSHLHLEFLSVFFLYPTFASKSIFTTWICIFWLG